MRAMITGIAGFVGSHLAEHLLEQGCDVSGISLPKIAPDNLAHILKKISLYRSDLLDKDNTRAIIDDARPDCVFHLAANSSVSSSWDNPAQTFEINILTGIHLLESCRALKNQVRILFVGSAEIYGGNKLSGKLNERSRFEPQNPYAISKLALDLASEQIAKARGMHLVRMRPMSHTGPRQGTGFAIPDWAKQISEIEAGEVEPIVKTGNLEAHRDFSDVRDIVRAYALAAKNGLPGEAYLVCSGHSRKIRDALEKLLSLAKVSISYEQDPKMQRPSDPSIFSASYSKLFNATGWRPKISFEKTLRDILAYWRTKKSNSLQKSI